MKLIPKNERNIKARTMLKAFKNMNAIVRQLGEYKKWKELYDGSRLSVSINVYEINQDTQTMYLLEDTLGRVCAELQPDKTEVSEWLKDHGYKTAHRFYIEDYGMTEETWRAWNSESEE